MYMTHFLHQVFLPKSYLVGLNGGIGGQGGGVIGRVNFCQKHTNMLADVFYCVFGCTDQLQQISE